MRKMLVMTGLVAAVGWGAVTAWAGPRTARRTDEPSVSRAAVAGLADAVRSVPARLGRERVPAAQPVDAASPADLTVAADVMTGADVAMPAVPVVPVPVTVALRADVAVAVEAADVAVPAVVAAAAAPEAAPVVADPIVESTPLIAVYAPPVAMESAPVGLAGATPAAAADPATPSPTATVEVVQCGGPDGWETVPDAASCPGDRALRIERVPVDA